MGYTTKEFCKICNVGRETLRHYEKLGFLHPEINPDNQYRTYSGWDASVIADIKRYQSIGFSLEQIGDILSEYGLENLIASMENRVEFYHGQIQYYQMLCKKSGEELDILRHIPQLSDRYTVLQIPAFLYVPDKDLCRAPFSNHAMKHLDFFTPCICVGRDFAGDEMRSDYSGWGLIAKKEYSDYLEIQSGIAIPASKAVCTIIDAGNKGNITKTLFEPFYSHIKCSGLNASSAIYACLLTRTHDSMGGYHRYLYTFCTISNEAPC